MLEHLLWDSGFLGFSVARLSASSLSIAEISAIISEARQAGVKLIYVIIEPADLDSAAAIQHFGAQLADRKLTFAMKLLPTSCIPPMEPSIGSATEYTTQLEALAWQSGEYSRFRLDSRFAPNVFQGLYSEWLRNSINKQIARQVLVFHDSADNECGLLTLGEKNKKADIGLLAVDATMRGQRVGQRLVAAAVHQAWEWGYHEIQVVTQRDNKPACRFYIKCGFQLANEQHIYHLWLG